MKNAKYSIWDIAVTEFPYAEKYDSKKRPVLICSNPFIINKNITLYWVLMITSTELKGWEGDFEIKNWKSVGLNTPSIVRTIKIACLDQRTIIKKIGVIEKQTQKKISEFLKTNIKS